MKLNIVFFGDFPYPLGMAGTKRVQHAISVLRNYAFCKVIITRQSKKDNPKNGTFQGISYLTVAPDLIGWRFGIFMPFLIIKSILAVRESFCKSQKNILYIYSYPFLTNIFAALYAKLSGWIVVFDIVEDESTAVDISRDWRHKVKIFLIQILTSQIDKFSNGVTVISSSLENKFRNQTNNHLPIHLRPISIDPKWFTHEKINNTIEQTLFYAGSFGVKDGIDILFDAFDRLSVKYPKVRLILVGKGNRERMKKIFRRIECSPVKSRIDYKGFVDDETYYKILSEVHIPCMTRIDSNYANAGFPFKLGEFLASGKPVIASNVSDVEKFITNQNDALIVKPGCSEGIVKAVEFIITNPKKAREIGCKGRQSSLKNFNYQSQGKKLFEFFNLL